MPIDFFPQPQVRLLGDPDPVGPPADQLRAQWLAESHSRERQRHQRANREFLGGMAYAAPEATHPVEMMMRAMLSKSPNAATVEPGSVSSPAMRAVESQMRDRELQRSALLRAMQRQGVQINPTISDYFRDVQSGDANPLMMYGPPKSSAGAAQWLMQRGRMMPSAY